MSQITGLLDKLLTFLKLDGKLWLFRWFRGRGGGCSATLTDAFGTGHPTRHSCLAKALPDL